MKPGTRRLGWLLAIAGLATTGYFAGRPWGAPPAGLEPARDELRALAARQDTTGLARLARRQCGPVTGSTQRCYEDFFVALTGGGQVRLALGTLADLAARERRIAADGHVYTHVVGITAWKPGMDVAGVFKSCTGLFQSGCYHGVIQSYLTADAGVDSAKVAWLCDLIEGNANDRWLRFQCVHGLGHGLEMIWNWDLPRSLAGCDWLEDGWDRDACYGGAFMENAVASLPGAHHVASRLVAEAGHPAGHAGQAASTAPGPPAPPPFKMRDSTDLLYPCTIMPERYLSSCYLLQGGMILRALRLDYAAAMAGCDGAPQPVRHNCYASIGTSASGLTLQNRRRTIAACSHGDPGYQPWCFVGAVKNYVDVTARAEDGLALCREVPAGPNRRQCYVAVGEQLRVLHADPALREPACAMAPPPDAADCRYGAALLAEPPPGLPIRLGSPGESGGAR